MLMLMLLLTFMVLVLMEIKNPFMGSLILIITTMLIMLEVSFSVSQWVAYLLMLLFLGGMMVLFLYVTSIMSSLKFKMKVSNKMIMSMIFVTPLMLMFSLGPVTTSVKFITISNLFNMDSFVYITLVLFYLLLGLVAVVSICKKFEGSLKSKVSQN